jgi:hypothetical protein
MRIARWIPKTKNAHSEYVILIAFPLQQWLHERASTLRYTYTARRVYAVFWLTLTLTACPAPARCTPLHTEYQQPKCWYEPTRKRSTGWVTFLQTEVNWAFVRCSA